MSVRYALVLALAACGSSTQAPAPAPGAAEPAPGAAATAPAPAAAGDLATDEDKILYVLGVSIGRSLAPFQLTSAELGKVVAGIDDSISGRPPKVDLPTWGPRIEELANARAAKAAGANAEKSKVFLDGLAATPGATVTPSGVVFVDVAPGTGPNPTPQDTVRVHYRGTLADGTVFDSSYDRGQPAVFSLGQVIPCWVEGIQKIKVGGKAKLGCPSNLAYGEHGMGSDIPPGAALQFEVELLGIEGK